MPVLKTPVRAALVVALGWSMLACSEGAVHDATPADTASAPAPAVLAPPAADPALTQASEMPGSAAPGVPFAGPMPALGGGMQALAEHCGGSSKAELAVLKQKQRDLAIQSGMRGTQFDADYAKGYDDTLAKIGQGTSAEREKACAQLKAFEQFGERLEQGEAARQR